MVEIMTELTRRAGLSREFSIDMVHPHHDNKNAGSPIRDRAALSEQSRR